LNPKVACAEGFISNLFYLSLEVGQGKTYKGGHPKFTEGRIVSTIWESQISLNKEAKNLNKKEKTNSKTPFAACLERRID
jgi:hypothetical protein